MQRFGLVLCAVLLASACSDGSTSTTVPTTTSPASTTTTTEADASGSGAESGMSCVGVWELDSEAFFETFNEVFSSSEPIEWAGGKYLVTWNADGTFSDVRDQWSLSFPNMPETGTMVLNSLGAGAWIDDGTSTRVTSYELTEASVSIVVDGEELELPAEPGGLPSGLFSVEPVVSCTESTMTVSDGEFESTLGLVG